MSTQPELPPVPAWDTADRMRKALRQSGISVEEMALYLDVSRRSIGNWINGHVNPSKQTLRLWAIRTGVSFDWLCHGDHERCATHPPAPVSASQGRVITGRYPVNRKQASIGMRCIPLAA